MRHRGNLGCGPQVPLQLGSSNINLPNLVLIAGLVEQNTLVKIACQQCARFRRIVGRQQVCPDVLRTNCVGLGLLVEFALIIAANRHRKGESDNKAEQRQGGSLNNAEILALVFFEISSPPAQPGTDPCRKPEHAERDRENDDREVHYIAHLLYSPVLLWSMYSILEGSSAPCLSVIFDSTHDRKDCL